MGRIWRLGDHLSPALTMLHTEMTITLPYFTETSAIFERNRKDYWHCIEQITRQNER